MSLYDTVMAQVVRMRSGDVLWVRLGPEADVDSVDGIRDAVVSAMPVDCSIIITEHHMVDRLGTASLDDLVGLRQIIDQAIDEKVSRSAMPEA